MKSATRNKIRSVGGQRRPAAPLVPEIKFRDQTPRCLQWLKIRIRAASTGCSQRRAKDKGDHQSGFSAECLVKDFTSIRRDYNLYPERQQARRLRGIPVQ